MLFKLLRLLGLKMLVTNNDTHAIIVTPASGPAVVIPAGQSAEVAAGNIAVAADTGGGVGGGSGEQGPP